MSIHHNHRFIDFALIILIDFPYLNFFQWPCYMKNNKSRATGQLVKAYRKAKGLSQMELADMIGVSYQQVQKYEKGDNRISVDRLKEIAKALDIPINEFFSSDSRWVSETTSIYGQIKPDEELLLHLFRSIKDKKLKRTIIELIRAIAKQQ